MSDIENPEYKARLFAEGVSQFNNARARAFWQEISHFLRGKSAELLSFEEVRTRLRLREESYRGLQNVPLDKIVGSVGRYRDFTRDFLPKSNDMKDRWSRVYAQANDFTGLPPIELYKVGDVYFVRDGNHRVSVANRLGQETIEAHVTELPTSIELSPDMSPEDLDSAAAYARFIEETGLKHSRPHHQPINLSEPSRYHDLLGHVYLHGRIMEQMAGQPVGFEDAAANWYDKVYRPAVTLIRKYGILEQEKDRTEGDLYLWLVDHLRELREQYGDDVRSRRFSDAVVDYLAVHKMPVPEELLTEEDESVILTKTQVMKAVAQKRAEKSAPNGHPVDEGDSEA